MPWNWELPNWPQFRYDSTRIAVLERQFLLDVGSASAYLKTVQAEDYHHFIVEILSLEGLESSRIEGELLNRESLQSSICRHFGLSTSVVRADEREARMAALLCSVYDTFDQPLTHEMLWRWHEMLFKGDDRLETCGQYRSHAEPMRIVSHRLDSPKVFFEAPPSSQVLQEMTVFIHWFNTASLSVLERAAVAHVYFESIHPFEDGNGRIGRALVEKILSQSVGRPVLVAVSKILEKRKKEYYAALEQCNRTLEVQHWLEFFCAAILQAHAESMQLLDFLMQKTKMLAAISKQLNPRQMKVLLRLFAEGPNGFKGGLSAEKYLAMTKTTRATATRDLTDLVEKGALVKTGELRHTRYWLNLHAR